MNIFTRKYNNKIARICLTNLHYDIIGSIFFSIGIYMFAEHADFIPGGISGVALILNHLYGLPVGITTLAINLPLVFLSYKIVGKEFIYKTIRSLVILTIFLDVIFPFFPYYSKDPMLAAVFAGVFSGIGMSMFYMHGSSSGGTDFIVMPIRVKFPYIPFGHITMAIDLVIISLGWPVFRNSNAVLFGLICSFATSVVMDKILYGKDAAKLLVIISDKNDEIAKQIGSHTRRGSTLLRGIGTYKKTEKDVLLCACSKTQTYQIIEDIHEIEPSAFIMITETSQIFGEGFITEKQL